MMLNRATWKNGKIGDSKVSENNENDQVIRSTKPEGPFY
jgi:hypothetical protein